MFIYFLDESPLHPLIIKGVVVLLQLLHGTICSCYHKNIRIFSTLRMMEKYICKKNNWDKQFDFVDWALHGMAIQSNYDMKHFLIKYIHNWLPVGVLILKYAI